MTEAIPKARPIFLDIPITHISKQDKDRRVVAGYASFDVIDRQNERITHEAMREALKNFMANPEYMNTHVMHGNCAVGKVIKSYKDKNGELWETKVDDTGTFIVSELRTDIKRAVQTWELIEKGVLKSYSIGGLALNPKELICNNGTCHWEIDKLEIHEFSYVDRPAVKGADFIIVKKEAFISPMSCTSNSIAPTMNEEDNVNKEETPNPDTIIMADSQAEPTTSETVEPKAKPKKATSKKAAKKESKPEPVVSPEPEITEKADATPILLEIKGMLEKVQSSLEEMRATRPGATRQETTAPTPEPKKFDYPVEQMEALTLQYGEEKSFHLLELIGDEAFKLLTVTKEEEQVEEPQKEPEPEPEAEPEMTEEAKEPEEAVESVPESTEKMIPETPEITIEQMVEAQVESTLEKYSKGQKRSPVPVIGEKPARTLIDFHNMDWLQVETLARRGA